MIETVVINYLIGLGIANGHVYAETPVDPDDEYVVVSRTRGSITDKIRSYGIYTESRAKASKADAAELHEAVIAAMQNICDTTTLMRCKLETDYDAAMTSTKEYRYQALWGITE